MKRNAFLLCCTLATAAGAQLPSTGHGQAYPDRPIRLIVGFPPGGAADILGRHAAQQLTESLGQQVVVDNRGGAGGLIATEIAARASPGGYTLLFTSLPHVINPHLYRKVSYDALKDFDPVVQFVVVPLATVEYLAAVWRRPEGEGAPTVERKKLREIVEVIGDVPKLPSVSLDFADWVANYTLASPGMVLRMMMSAGSAFEPPAPRYGVRLAGTPPERMTPARSGWCEPRPGAPPDPDDPVLASVITGLLRSATPAL